MSIFSAIFGSGGKKEQQQQPQGDASVTRVAQVGASNKDDMIRKLETYRKQIETLEKKVEHLDKQIDDCTKKAIAYKNKGDKTAAMQLLNRRKMLTSSRDSTWGSMQKIQEMQFALEQAHNHAETLSIIDEGTRTIAHTRKKYGLDEDQVYDINERLRDELDTVSKVGEMLASDATEDDPDLLDELNALGDTEAAPAAAAAVPSVSLPSAPLPTAPVGVVATKVTADEEAEAEAEFAALAAAMN